MANPLSDWFLKFTQGLIRSLPDLIPEFPIGQHLARKYDQVNNYRYKHMKHTTQDLQKIYPLGDNKGYVELVGVMGSDLEVVNDARVSYERHSDEWTEKDARLLRFLIMPIDEPQHTSPLRGSAIKLQVKAPLYIARQWWKHHIASSYSEGQDGWNEKSLRYSKVDIHDYYIPEAFPMQAKVNKQASDWMSAQLDEKLMTMYKMNVERCADTYNQMIEAGYSREIARGVLPACYYTTFRWTVSLHGLLNFLDLRSGHGAQAEITKYARSIRELVKPYFIHTMEAWDERKEHIKFAMEVTKHLSNK